ncbi:50S ribosomal subunit protein L20 [Candidatus Hodgkinia cicadicola]|uniref:Large ribosomal subunit protein bL20 n=1 Tax=Candidatus Hodgkinia cicadicola TaxID=573658 RepID=A0ABX4MGF5_9HYPH|nr:50S ribosomal subunit protein L20 [Candidatus Hodgkinia cicadicola]
MSRVSRGITSHKKHKKVLKLAKGYYGRRKSCIRMAKQAVDRSLSYRYKSNRLKKRIMRTKLIKHLNQHSNERAIGYRLIMFGLCKLGLNYTLSTLNKLSQSKLIYDVLMNLLILIKK